MPGPFRGVEEIFSLGGPALDVYSPQFPNTSNGLLNTAWPNSNSTQSGSPAISVLQQSLSQIQLNLATQSRLTNTLENKLKEQRGLSDNLQKDLDKAREYFYKVQSQVNKLKNKTQNSEKGLVSVLGIFAALFTFVSVNFQFYKETSSLGDIYILNLILLGSLSFFVGMIVMFFRHDINDDVDMKWEGKDDRENKIGNPIEIKNNFGNRLVYFVVIGSLVLCVVAGFSAAYWKWGEPLRQQIEIEKQSSEINVNFPKLDIQADLNSRNDTHVVNEAPVVVQTTQEIKKK